MARPPLAPGVTLHAHHVESDSWLWADALPLLEVGAQVRVSLTPSMFELGADRVWRNMGHADATPFEVSRFTCELIRTSARPLLVPGVLLHTVPPLGEAGWTWAEALPLLEVGAQVRLFSYSEPVFELRADGTWTDEVLNLAVPVTERMCVLVRPSATPVETPAAEPAPATVEFARPPLPAPLPAMEDALDQRVRSIAANAAADILGVLAEDLRAHPDRASRRLRVGQTACQSFGQVVRELALEDDDPGEGELEGYGGLGVPPLRRRRRAGGHVYAEQDQQGMIAEALRAQRVSALTATMAQTAPGTAGANAEVYAAAQAELTALIRPGGGAVRPAPPADPPAAAEAAAAQDAAAPPIVAA